VFIGSCYESNLRVPPNKKRRKHFASAVVNQIRLTLAAPERFRFLARRPLRQRPWLRRRSEWRPQVCFDLRLRSGAAASVATAGAAASAGAFGAAFGGFGAFGGGLGNGFFAVSKMPVVANSMTWP